MNAAVIFLHFMSREWLIFFLGELLNMDIVVLVPKIALQQKISALLKTAEEN